MQKKVRTFCFGILVKKLAHTHGFEHETSGLKSKHLTTRPRTRETCELPREIRELSRGKKKHPHFTITLAYRKCKQIADSSKWKCACGATITQAAGKGYTNLITHIKKFHPNYQEETTRKQSTLSVAFMKNFGTKKLLKGRTIAPMNRNYFENH